MLASHIYLSCSIQPLSFDQVRMEPFV